MSTPGSVGDLAGALAALARSLTEADVREVAKVLRGVGAPGAPGARAKLLDALPVAEYRRLAAELHDAWLEQPEQAGTAVGLALRAAWTADRERREALVVDLAWTGPTSLEVPVRRTDQALLEVIRAAKRDLWVVSFATWKVPEVEKALQLAVARGVDVRLVLESADESEGYLTFDRIEELAALLGRRAAVLVWPTERRPEVHGKRGVLHAKCAVADDQVMFVSSANLTAAALTCNMEVGLLVRGGGLPGRVCRHLRALVEAGTLQPA